MRFLKTTFLFYKISLMVTLTYRWSLAQLILGEIIGTVGLVLFWYEAARQSPSKIYTTDEIIIYFLFATMHTILGDSGINKRLSIDISSGKVAASLIRPFPPLLAYTVQGFAQMTFRAVVLLPILFLVCFLYFGKFTTGLSIIQYGAGNILMMILAAEMGLILGLLAFKMTQTWAPEIIFFSLYFVFGGTSYPVDALAPGFQEVVKSLPFYYLCGFPASVLLGHKTVAVFYQELCIGTLWTVILAGLIVLMWRQGRTQFEGVGI